MTELKEMLNRDLNIGDFILDISKLPVSDNSYGLVVSKDSIFVNNKVVNKKGNVYKIVNPDYQEKQIFSDLVCKYNLYTNDLLLKSSVSSNVNYNIGDVIISNKIKGINKSGLYLGYVQIESLDTNCIKKGYGYIIDLVTNFQFYYDNQSSFEKMMYMSYAYASHSINNKENNKIYMLNKYFKIYTTPLPATKVCLHLNIDTNSKYYGKINNEELTFLIDR